MKLHFLILSFLLSINLNAQYYSFTVKKQRPPLLEVYGYKQLAIGDIVGPYGSKDGNSLSLTDEMTSRLFNSNTYEVIDRNALANILSSQKGSDIQLITENTTTALSKKLNSALLVIGRLENEIITQESRSDRNGTTTCGNDYWWEAKYQLTAQLKVIDVKTGRMLFSNPVSYTRQASSVKSCQVTEKFSREYLSAQNIQKLADEIVKVLVPYTDEIRVDFEKPAITIFKNPLKKSETAAEYFQAGNSTAALAILKAFVDDGSLKDKVHNMAVFNYAQGLYAAADYDLALEQYKDSIDKGYAVSNCMAMQQLIAKEKNYIVLLTRRKEMQEAALKKQEEQPDETINKKPETPATKSSKPVIAAPVKRRKT